MKNTELKDKIILLPHNPGVYRFYDKDGVIIYIGKAKDLRKRVASYFSKTHDNAKTRILVRKIVDVSHIIVKTETDALLLENNLIKKHQPRYNVMLKDDKTYPWICIKNESFPRIFQTRNIVKDGSLYFGPYTSIMLVRTMLDLIKKLFQIRNCKLNLSQANINAGKFKVCLEYHIKNCQAPCVNLQKEVDYNQSIEQIKNILKGNISTVKIYLKELMAEYAEALDFEKAQLIKEKITVLEKYQSKSTIVSPTIKDIDVFTISDDEKFAYVNYIKVANGSVIQAHTIEIKKKLDETKQELLPRVIIEIREKFHSEAKEILVQFKPEIEIEGMDFIVPQIGDKKKLLDLSLRNVLYYHKDRKKQQENLNPEKNIERKLEVIKKDLRLSELPYHIEGFDNSNISGTHAVAACVVFKNAKPSKKDYRHYKIKTVEGPDDFASMTEIITRRYTRLVNEEQPLPQLIVIDGGKGQLHAALNALDEINLRGKIAIIGIAKKLEEIYYPGDSIPLYLNKNSETLKLIQFIRNESHRFGINFHRQLRSKGFAKSELHSIKGLGDKTVQKLLKEFKSVAIIKTKNTEDIAKIVGNSKANIVVNYFNNYTK